MTSLPWAEIEPAQKLDFRGQSLLNETVQCIDKYYTRALEKMWIIRTRNSLDLQIAVTNKNFYIMPNKRDTFLLYINWMPQLDSQMWKKSFSVSLLCCCCCCLFCAFVVTIVVFLLFKPVFCFCFCNVCFLSVLFLIIWQYFRLYLLELQIV